MGSGPNCDDNGNGKMGIIATDGGGHIDSNRKKKILNLFVVAVAV